MQSFYSADYFEARQRFREAVARLGGTHEYHLFGTRGAQSEPLTTDFGRFGDAGARRLLIISSGLHGIEGFFGSAVQLAWMAAQSDTWQPPSETAVMLAHSLNPYGFSWHRRCNENNVDLNRNFLTDDSFRTNDPHYLESLAIYLRQSDVLNVPGPPSRLESFWWKAMRRVVSEGYQARSRMMRSKRPSRVSIGQIVALGLAELRKSLPVGQYEVPAGVFFGGIEPEETTRMFGDNVANWMTDAEEVLHLDLHTGLGRFGEHVLLLGAEPGSDRDRWAKARFNDRVEALGGPTAYRPHGDMLEFLQATHGENYHGLTAEFGTYSGIHVLGVLCDENRAHLHADRQSATYRWAKKRLMEAFAPASRRWRDRTLRDGVALIDRGLAALATGRG